MFGVIQLFEKATNNCHITLPQFPMYGFCMAKFLGQATNGRTWKLYLPDGMCSENYN